MASVISASTTSATALNMSADTTGVLQLATGATPTTAVTIDTSQNVGIGTTSPSQLSTYRTLDVRGSVGGGFRFGNATDSGYLYSDSNETNIASATSKPLLLSTNTAERMRIDSSGNVGIGTTSPTTKLSFGNFIPSNGQTLHIYQGGNSVTGLGVVSGVYRIFTASDAVMSFGQVSLSDGSTYTERMQINTSGGLILAGSTAQKATGTTWSNPSDQRLKDNIRDYTKGTTELMQVRVREWEYNGKGGTTEGMKGLGVVADEVMTVLPNTVETYNAKLNEEDEETTEIKKFDATEITWLLVKTVQEQQAIINDLKARVTALEAK